VLIPPQKNAGVLSDVASKPIFIAAAEEKAKTATLLGIQYFIVIDQQSNIFVSSALAQQVEWLDPEVNKNNHVKLITLN
jgi:thiamine biosynthesis lipoprotein